MLFSVLVVSGRRMTTLEQTRTLFRVAPVGDPLITVGLVLVRRLRRHPRRRLRQRSSIWDPWIIVAIVLVIAFGGVGQRTGAYYTNVQQARRGVRRHRGRGARAACARRPAPCCTLVTVVLFVLIVLDMIFKPGA